MQTTRLMLTGAAVLAMSSATNAQAQSCDTPTDCLTVALTGLVKGFTGSAGSDLWGWMLGGSQSAGVDAINDDLETINSTLATIATDLTTIQDDLEELSCGIDTNFIDQYAADIQSYYNTYQNWLTTMQSDGSLPRVATVSEWANCVVGDPASGQTCQNPDILTLMNDLNDAATSTASGATGSISACIKTKANKPTASSIDDRPYYTANVVPITDWYLNLNTQAMMVVTEAYHFRAWQTAGSPSSGSADEIYPNVCPTDSAPEGCGEPISFYHNDFVPFTMAQLQAGGAPYSTDEYLMVNGNKFLIARSIEQYNVADDPGNSAGCSTTEPGGLTSADVCGATAGKYNDPFPSVAFGPYAYGVNGYGNWGPAPNVGTLGTILAPEFNASSAPADAEPGDYLCTMSFSGGDSTTCTQAQSGGLANGGAGLFYGDKIVVFPNLASNEFTDTNATGPQVLFMDAGIGRGTAPQPNTAGEWYLDVPCSKCGCDGFGDNTWAQTPSWASEEIDPAWYTAGICLPTEGGASGNGWGTAPGYDPSATFDQYRWPALDWNLLTCSNGKPPTDSSNQNPIGVPSLCGRDFQIWFDAIVPSPLVSTPAGDIAGTNNGDSCWLPQNLVVLAIGDYSLIWQDDGNLVLYVQPATTAIPVWASNTSGTGQQLCWGLDGNLVIYGAGATVLYTTSTADAEHGGNGGQDLQLHYDGTLDIVNADGGRLWVGYQSTSRTATAAD